MFWGKRRRDQAALHQTALLTGQLEQLAWTLSAYRPGPLIERSGTPFPSRLHLLGNVANDLGLTSGDVLVLAVELLQEIDRLEDFNAAFEEVSRKVFIEGTITTVYELPIRQFVRGEDVADLLGVIGFVFRAEAWREAQTEDHGSAEATRLLSSYREQLAAMGAGALL